MSAKEYRLWAPGTEDEGLTLNTDDYPDLIGAIQANLEPGMTSVDLYYFSRYELISEGMIFPNAKIINNYLRDVIKQHGDVALVFESLEAGLRPLSFLLSSNKHDEYTSIDPQPLPQGGAQADCCSHLPTEGNQS